VYNELCRYKSVGQASSYKLPYWVFLWMQNNAKIGQNWTLTFQGFRSHPRFWKPCRRSLARCESFTYLLKSCIIYVLGVVLRVYLLTSQAIPSRTKNDKRSSHRTFFYYIFKTTKNTLYEGFYFYWSRSRRILQWQLFPALFISLSFVADLSYTMTNHSYIYWPLQSSAPCCNNKRVYVCTFHRYDIR